MELAYDLRQIYARIVGDHLIDASTHRKSGKYFLWFKSLEDLKTVVKHKFKNQEKAIENYNKLVGNIKELANKYPGAWLCQSTDQEQISKIENVLRELEEFLYLEMQKGKVFGEGGRQVSF